MKLLERILLATNFDQSSESLLENGITLSKTFNSQIILVHVLPENVENEKVRLLLEEGAEKHLADMGKKMAEEGVKIGKTHLLFGNPYDRITLLADELNANVILIGSGEISKNDVSQLGTTANKIIRKSNKPVWVVKQGKSLDIKKIICPIDFSAESKRALKNTITLARRFNSKLIIFSVCEAYQADSLRNKAYFDKENERERLVRVSKLNLFLTDFNLTKLSYDIEVVVGHPATEILNAISRHSIDLLVMGTTGKSGLDRLMMGSVTEKVVGKVPCSFVTLKEEDIIDVPFENKIRDIETYYDIAMQLENDGLYPEAIEKYKMCLDVSDMHIPTLNRIAEVYAKQGDTAKAGEYKKMAGEILSRIWEPEIEAEIRKFYKI
ncbi:universal stress protein [Mangrovibacterium sp.]|uniref:universal stress protein n=1 Tax=Mangrovibacterium sp. TaxID=1961364 RepID=UPI00356170C8